MRTVAVSVLLLLGLCVINVVSAQRVAYAIFPGMLGSINLESGAVTQLIKIPSYSAKPSCSLVGTDQLFFVARNMSDLRQRTSIVQASISQKQVVWGVPTYDGDRQDRAFVSSRYRMYVGGDGYIFNLTATGDIRAIDGYIYGMGEQRTVLDFEHSRIWSVEYTGQIYAFNYARNERLQTPNTYFVHTIAMRPQWNTIVAIATGPGVMYIYEIDQGFSWSNLCTLDGFTQPRDVNRWTAMIDSQDHLVLLATTGFSMNMLTIDLDSCNILTKPILQFASVPQALCPNLW